jgi:hypothetical protein
MPPAEQKLTNSQFVVLLLQFFERYLLEFLVPFNWAQFLLNFVDIDQLF